MRKFSFILFSLITAIYFSCAPVKNNKQSETSSSQPDPPFSTPESSKKINDDFQLDYSCTELGPSFLSMEPVFRISGTKFLYTQEQTAFYEGEKRKDPIMIDSGTIRNSSIDTILYLISKIKDPIIYKTNIHIIDGAIHYISISKGKIHTAFQLHNETDSTAKKIVNILNSYIAYKDHKLWLFGD